MLYRRSLHARLFRTRKLAWNSLGKGLYKSQSGLTLKRWTWVTMRTVLSPPWQDPLQRKLL